MCVFAGWWVSSDRPTPGGDPDLRKRGDGRMVPMVGGERAGWSGKGGHRQ
jgi:hypothetical protein